MDVDRESLLVRINVCLVPSPEEINRVLELINQFRDKLDFKFVVDDVDFLLHATIYSPLIPRKFLQEIISELKEHDLLGSIKLPSEKVSLTWIDKNYIQLVFPDYSENLKRLHLRVLSIVNKFRGDLITDNHKSQLYSDTVSQEAKSNILKYGIPATDSLFKLHLSLGLLNQTDEQSLKLVELMGNNIKELSLIGLSVYEMDNLSACRNILAC